MTEAEMSKAKAPWPKTMGELADYCETLWSQENNDYGKAVYCISLATEAMFNLAASRVGASGFQASCADLTFLAKRRSMEHGFQLVDYSKALFPQYLESDPVLAMLFDQIAPSLRKAAQAKLDEASDTTSPAVIAHWKRIVALPEVSA